jgi:WD40 repeat protein
MGPSFLEAFAVASRWRAILIALLLGGSAQTALAAQPDAAIVVTRPERPPQEPMLRIEPETHWAPINRIAVDKACSLLVSGSVDKTARVWQLPARKASAVDRDARPPILERLRPPIGEGFEGRIYTVALSPNTKLVAMGGWFGRDPPNRFDWVYVFDRTKGEVAQVLGPVSHRVIRLAFSPNGDRLAATLKGGEGLRVWETRRWQLIGSDASYEGGADTYGVAFDALGNLFTASHDGFLRRYSARSLMTKHSVLVPEKKVKTRVGTSLDGLALHPKGDRVALVFDDRTVVDVHDTKTLGLLYSTDTRPKDNGGFDAAAWSADGQRLYAAGTYEVDDNTIIRTWEDAGKGPGKDLAVGPNQQIMDLLTCGSGIAFASTDPAFGIVDEIGTRRLWQPSVIPDQRDKRGGDFTVSDDGLRVRFGLQRGGGMPVLFDLSAERLSEAAEAPKNLHAANTESIKVTNWIDNLEPKLAGAAIALDKYEHAHSLAVAPDKSIFVLGTDWKLRAYDGQGKPVWSTPQKAPSIVWGLNIAGNGKLLVAAYGDGTIRWHRLTDGQELLALFVNAEDKRWIAWTPRGYYTASAGGESLIGWHVNRGWKEPADYFPAYRFRNRFYRPDIVQRVLAELDEDKAIAEAERLAGAAVPMPRTVVASDLPPVLEIRSPADWASFTTASVTLQYTARAPTGDNITDVEVLIDGQRLKSRGFVPVATTGKDVLSLELALPRRNVTLTLIASAGDKRSDPRSLHLVYVGPQRAIKKQPRLLALMVGISAYQQQSLKLSFADRDAEQFAQALKEQEGRAFNKVDVHLLKNAPRKDILADLGWLENTAE